MTKTVFALAFCAFACSALAETGVPTPEDNTKSVLVNAQTPASEAKQEASCPETAREVRLGHLQARRLARQADRQEARAACECCKGKCECCKKKDCRPTALVATKSAPKYSCGCK